VESCLYEGRVHHRRRRPVEHVFEAPLFMLYLDLEELPDLFRDRWLWSAERPALAWFRREDHLGDPDLPLDRAVRELVAECSGYTPRGPIRLLTHLRYFGYAFNPVSFYYCFAPDASRLEAIVAEVTNTPWRERHCYVLVPEAPNEGADAAEEARAALRFITPKSFHVSPFMGMDVNYRWTFRMPGERLAVQIASYERGSDRFFDASLALTRREITGAALARALVRYPAITAQVVARIYWQAWRLRRKGIPWNDHPHRPRSGGALLETRS
jgi:uncharacterized protein